MASLGPYTLDRVEHVDNSPIIRFAILGPGPKTTKISSAVSTGGEALKPIVYSDLSQVVCPILTGFDLTTADVFARERRPSYADTVESL